MDPNGLAVQGWKVDNRGGVTQAAGGMTSTTEEKKSDIIGSGVPMDVKLDTWTVAPQQTTKITFKSQLPNKGSDNARDSTNPFAALFQSELLREEEAAQEAQADRAQREEEVAQAIREEQTAGTAED